MKQWSTAVLPLSILLTLAALTFWLRYATEFPDTHSDGKHRHDPDYIVSEVTVRKLDKTGMLRHTLFAEELRHYPDDDSTELIKPTLVHVQPGRPRLTVKAAHGRLTSQAERVDLREDVEVHREADGKHEALLVSTTELTVLPDEEKAFTKSKVVITQGKSSIQGVGMQVDNKLRTFVLEAQVNGLIDSHRVK
ncbi:MAG: LPS export ABC transporter periplasmic protein LptC [Candidatus Accumulibacter sp.]|uniref:LPS export ABC transporter periplasmic protein LptC n=1 Tax=Accumulibacter sp. TaxID=2053492 RepID=UPI00287AC5AF|nr:LPS export ABC transporter periplasmic protein LptC [Accumulibacter sp.]MDS4016272.1 LPS export ABC transporter periplasmic protein LptC [Accumulibacter sp.]